VYWRHHSSTGETGKGGTKYRSLDLGNCIRFVFLGSIIIGPLRQLTLSVHAQVTLQLTDSLSGLLWRFLARVSLLRARTNRFIRSKPAVGGPAQSCAQK